MNEDIIVLKLNLQREITWQYRGRVLRRGPHFVCLEARFQLPDTTFHGMLLGSGDRFVETFYSDRWYNIFEIHAREDDHLRGWYCNIGYPATIRDHAISYVDLALDLLVFPDGRQIVLDEDEFAALPLSEADRRRAWDALRRLQEWFRLKLKDDL